MANGCKKALKYELLEMLVNKYDNLTEAETKQLVVENKWMATIATLLGKRDAANKPKPDHPRKRTGQGIYAQTLSSIDADIVELEEKVKKHLAQMGFAL